jgi:hypothetical protein
LQNKQNRLNDINNKLNLVKADSIKTQSRLEDLETEIKNNVFQLQIKYLKLIFLNKN